jgi:hypothetical protein
MGMRPWSSTESRTSSGVHVNPSVRHGLEHPIGAQGSKTCGTGLLGMHYSMGTGPFLSLSTHTHTTRHTHTQHTHTHTHTQTHRQTHYPLTHPSPPHHRTPSLIRHAVVETCDGYPGWIIPRDPTLTTYWNCHGNFFLIFGDVSSCHIQLCVVRARSYCA